ncbi:MAG: DUF4168 domain-containing protein [Cryomorphaceae bacterium]|nr:DUF4168 domain-containing protein [Flavobacteriales bacterium]
MSFIAMFLFAGASVFAQGETEITSDELEKFASALGNIQTVNQTAQEEMMTAVESADMNIERFNELSQAQQDPNAKVEASPDEMEKFNSASQKVQKVQQDAQDKMQTNIEKAGLTVDRYQEIAAVVQNDPEMQKKLQELMQG